jgi:membrane protease YdiL (CAAX protease family)
MSQAGIALAYFAVYIGYLFVHLETEIGHWLSLVLLPSVIVVLTSRRSRQSIAASLATLGISGDGLLRGLGWAIPIGVGLCALQLWASRDGRAMAHFLTTYAALPVLAMALALSLVTAAFTEEFFFRGFLQYRLEQAVGRAWLAVGITAILFGLYHLPYAYLNPRWPSHGNWMAAAGAAFGQGIPGGLILGTVFVRSRHNLLACVLVHALINLFPIALMLARARGRV